MTTAKITQTHSKFVALLVACAGGLVAADRAMAQTTATWDRGGGTNAYSVALNWNPDITPINNGSNTYSVVLNSGANVFTDAGTPTTINVTDFSMAGGSSFDVQFGRTFNVLGTATLGGQINVSSPGAFIANTPGLALNAGARFAVTNGGLIQLGGVPTWNAYVYAYDGYSTDLVNATGTNSRFQATGISSIIYGGSSYGQYPQNITATLGGSIDLSGVQTLRCANGEDDVLNFNLSLGGTLNLNALQTINASGGNGNHSTNFNLGDGTSLSLPSLITADRIRVNLGVGSTFSATNMNSLTASYLSLTTNQTVNLGAITNMNNTRLAVSGGANLSGFAAVNYDCSYYWGGSYDMFSSTGAGSNLNLSTMQTLRYATNSGNNTLTIGARNGGNINLSGLQSISIAPGDDDTLRFELSGGTINLNSLATIALAGNTGDTVTFALSNNSNLNLPALTSANRLRVSIASGSALTMPALTSLTQSYIPITTNMGTLSMPALSDITNTRFIVSGGATFSAVNQAALESSYFWSGSYDMFVADGAGSSLTLGIANFRAGTNSGRDIITIAARNGGSLNLSSLTAVGPRTDQDDIIRFELSGAGSSLNLNGLTSTFGSSNGNGRTQFDAGAGTNLSLPVLATGDQVRFVTTGNASISAPLLTNLNRSEISDSFLSSTSTLSLPSLTTFTNGTLSLVPGRTVTLGQLNDVSGSFINVAGGLSGSLGTLGNITNSIIRVSAGQSVTSTATSYNNIFVWNYGNYDFLTATGVGSSLNLSSVASIRYGNYGQYTNYIAARDGGTVNLSGLTTVNVQNGEDDYLRFETIGAGSSINLNSLQTVSLAGNRYERVVFAPGAGLTMSLPALATTNRTLFEIADGATLNAPALTSFNESTLTITPGRTFNAPNINNIDRTRVLVSGGSSYSLPLVTSYNSAFYWGYNGDYEMFTADGAGSSLSMANMTTLNYGTDTGRQTQYVSVRNGGNINLSGLNAITIQSGQDDILRFDVTSGNINLNSLATINNGSNGNAYTQFNLAAGQSQSLPNLTSATRLYFTMAAGSSVSLPQLASAPGWLQFDLASNLSVNLPALTSVGTLYLTLAQGASVSAPALTSLGGWSLNLGTGATFSAPNLTALTGTTLNVTPTWGITLGGTFTNIDGSRILVSGGASFGPISTPLWTNVYTYNNGNYDIMSATGAGSTVNGAGIQAIKYGISGGNTYYIAARNGGTVNLSGLTNITIQNGEDDTLEFQTVGTGSTINLNGLTTVALTGNTYDRVRFNVGDGLTQNLPSLTTANRTDFTLGVGSTLNAPALTTLNESTLNYLPGRTLNLGALTNIDNSRIIVSGGAVATTNTANFYHYFQWASQLGNSYQMLQADGAGSVLNATSMRTLFYGDYTGRRTLNVTASAGGRVDLSALQTITVQSGQDDILSFVATGTGSVLRGGQVSTYNMQGNGNDYVTWNASLGGRLEFTELSLPTRVQLNITDDTATAVIDRSLYFRAGGYISMAPASQITIGKHLYNYSSTEANMVMTQGIVNVPAAGIHFWEVAGLDFGPMTPPASASGNFGVGRLVVGTSTVAAYLQLVDLYDNGNRGANLPEALYIFGVGQGTAYDSLVLQGGSILFMDNINVYVRENGNWIWLNSLFGPSQSVVAWGGGFLHLPSPGAAALLGLGGLVASRRRRHSTR